jgi:organic hydroperoxide reductase OsmC/OhrA
VTLRPRIVFAGAVPDKAKLDELHHQAHELCFIANSVKTEILIEPTNEAA